MLARVGIQLGDGRQVLAAPGFLELGIDPAQVIVSNGAKHSIHNALAALVGPGDEVVIPTPYWVSYSDLVQMTGATYVLVPTTLESGFKISPAQLKSALTSRSKVLMLNSPGNPSGADEPLDFLFGQSVR